MGNYAFDPELRRWAKFRIPNIWINGFWIALANAACALSGAFSRTQKDIEKKRYIIEGYWNNITLFCYTPRSAAKPMPCLLYFHGGGFFMRDVAAMHKRAQRYAADSGAAVLFVRYTLSGKRSFPAAPEDCYAALLWAKRNAAALGIDDARIAVSGDSAGGALAAAVCQMARDRDGPPIAAQMLVYPVTDVAQNTESAKRYTDVPMWNANLNGQMWGIYLRDGDFGALPYASPNSAKDLGSLPPAYIETTEFDCLRDEGIAYAQRLEQAGVPVLLNETRGTFHGYDMASNAGVTQRAMESRITFLKKHLSKGAAQGGA